MLFGRDIAALVFSESAETPEATDSGSGPLAELKGRYARGEIDEAEFERRLDRIVALEELDGKLPLSGVDSQRDPTADERAEHSDKQIRETN